MKRKFGLFLVTLFFFSALQAQNTFQPKQINTEQVGLVYDKEFTIDLRLHTHGFLAIAANFARIKTYYKTRFYHFEIGEIRHFKEERFNFDQAGGGRNSRSFVFGKRNSFYVIRAGLGEKRYFSEKAKEKGLSIGISYLAGPSLGFLKPYYLDLKYTNDNGSQLFDIRSEKYSEENAALFLNSVSIFGSSGFSKGLGEIKPMPGLHGKIGVHFDWGAFDEMVKALEAGIMVDVYFKKVPLMVENDEIQNAENRPFFVNLYLNLQLGKRW